MSQARTMKPLLKLHMEQDKLHINSGPQVIDNRKMQSNQIALP